MAHLPPIPGWKAFRAAVADNLDHDREAVEYALDLARASTPARKLDLGKLLGVVLVMGVSALAWTLIVLGAMAVLYSAMRGVG